MTTGSDTTTETATETDPATDCTPHTAAAGGVQLPIIYRDFKGNDVGGHPDFEVFTNDAVVLGMVAVNLGTNGPEFTGTPGEAITSASSFSSWYSDDASNMVVPDTLSLMASGNAFAYSNDRFFPLDDRGFVGAGMEDQRGNGDCGGADGETHNFSFTSELRFSFNYRGDESLTFNGDDDVWIFVNDRLIIDLGGVHQSVEATFAIDAAATDEADVPLALEEGKVYEAVVYHAERHTCGSNYSLTLNNFGLVDPSCDE